jgi:hypothetical protein
VKAGTHPLKAIFQNVIQYVVPLYQRPYVWREDTHWAPLWEDIQATVAQILPVPSSGSAGSHADPVPHFLGAIVLDQQRTTVGTVEKRHVIDGQQRLTTLQLFISAAAHEAKDRGLDKQSRILAKLVENDPDLIVDEGDRLKLCPTNVDRSAFRNAVLAKEAEDDPFNLVEEAHTYFRGSISNWLQEASSPELSAQTLLAALTDAIRELIQIVVIDLEEGDNAQVIFETLNARGTPLLAIDLVKNLFFLRIQRAGDDLERLYRNHWKPLERTYWREEIRQGRLRRPRAEIYLMHWLALQTKDEVLAHHLYEAFRKFVTGLPDEEMAPLLRVFTKDAGTFANFEEQPPGTPEYRFFDHLVALDTTTVMPLALFLFRQTPEVLPIERRRLALLALESWLVRRMICGLTPKSYNRYMLELLRNLDENAANAPDILVSKLRAAKVDTNLWPNDEQVVGALTSMPLYRRLSTRRVRMILTALENSLRTAKSEAILLPENLTVEHVLPQSWRDYWPTDRPGDIEQELNREAHVNRLGNLTLITSGLNSPLSNNNWATKRAEINEHSLLLLNRRLINDHGSLWDEATIDARSRTLAEQVLQIWPGPGADWDVEAQTDLLQDVSAPPLETSGPEPEDLIRSFSSESGVRLLEDFLDQVALWDEVKVQTGKAASHEHRRIFFYRKGSPYGAFCRINPRLNRVRLRLDTTDVPAPQSAQLLQVQDPYRVQVTVDTPPAFGEALHLARIAYEQAVASEEEF